MSATQKFSTLGALLTSLFASAGQAASLPTQNGYEFGLTLGAYHYQEPGLMSLRGIKTGIDLRSTISYPRHLAYLRGELRYAGGLVEYRSDTSGNNSNEPDWYLEGRVLVGKDRLLVDAVISIYTGLGYRFLMNDGRGLTSLRAAGYRRESNYLYLPLGLIHRRAWKSGGELVSTIEYDHLLSGTQFTQLSDTQLGYADITSKQNKGHGMKLSLLYTNAKWSLGPYLHYWNIADSEINPVYRYGVLNSYGLEPQNTTTEIGLSFNQSF